MQMVFVIVGGQGVGLAVELEFASGNAVAITADEGAEIRRFFLVLLQVGQAYHYARLIAVFIGRNPTGYNTAVIGDLNGYPVFIGECK
jgi:hypothetical protein